MALIKRAVNLIALRLPFGERALSLCVCVVGANRDQGVCGAGFVHACCVVESDDQSASGVWVAGLGRGVVRGLFDQQAQEYDVLAGD